MLSLITTLNHDSTMSRIRNIFRMMSEVRTPFEVKLHGREGSIHLASVIPMGTKRAIRYVVSVEYNEGYGNGCTTSFAFSQPSVDNAIAHAIRCITSDCKMQEVVRG